MSRTVWILSLLLMTGVVVADERPVTEPGGSVAKTRAPNGEEAKRIDGMSILGNQEAPTSLVIVPWKSSEIGDSLAISTMLDDSKRPVDREVFLRALNYYEIRSSTKP